MPILLRPNKKANSKKSLTQPMLLCFRTILSACKSSATWAKQLSNQHQNEQQGQLLAPRVWAPSWTPQKRFAPKAVHLLPLHLCLWLYRHLPCSSIVPQRLLCLDKKSKTICLVMYCILYIIWSNIEHTKMLVFSMYPRCKDHAQNCAKYKQALL